MNIPRWLVPALCLVLVLGWLGACSDDDDPAKPEADTTPPEVLGTDPAGAEGAVAVDDSVIVVFSEAMDPDSADGAVTLSAGTVTGSVWYTDRLLAVGHTDWPEGTEITCTVGTALTDEAGNALAADRVFSFWTWSSTELLLIGTTPADGATGVNRDASILLNFSEEINTATVAAAIRITDDSMPKADYSYDHDEIGDGQLLLDPDGSLPADTEFTVVIGTSLASDGGRHLAATEHLTFTTGAEVDNTAPSIIATDPTNGATSVSADKGFIRLTFSEPVNQETLEPVAWNLAFYFMMQQMEIEPFWTDGGTVLTVPLPSGLPSGMPIEVTFDGFEDLAGNAQTTPYTYEIKIAGAADYIPADDGMQYVDEYDVAWGEGGSAIPLGTDSFNEYVQVEDQPGGSYREVEYEDWDFATTTGDWEEFRQTGGALQWLAFEDLSKANVFDTPLTILPLPLSPGTWESTTQVEIPGEGTFRATLSGRVIGRADYPVDGPAIYIADAWSVFRELQVEFRDGNSWVHAFTETDSIWYAPTYGELRTVSREVEIDGGDWEETEVWRIPPRFTKTAARFGRR
ncbi:MAG: Ig-like domain-containing protein [bacterium]|nr:Ig-like domain-containing protein [bacterium]